LPIEAPENSRSPNPEPVFESCQQILRWPEAEENSGDALCQMHLSFLPPRAYCERSFELCDGWVEAGQESVIEASTIVTAAFDNLPPPPYAIAYARLDGISTALINFIREIDLSDASRAAELIKPGTPVRVAIASGSFGH
jgi:hypothetical protein